MVGSVYLSIYNKLSKEEQNIINEKVEYEEKKAFEESIKKDQESKKRR